MITKQNIGELMQTIETEDIHNALDAPHDYIYLKAHIFNAGAYATIESVDYDEDQEKEAHANGDLYADKDSFRLLLEETEALEY